MSWQSPTDWIVNQARSRAIARRAEARWGFGRSLRSIGEKTPLTSIRKGGLLAEQKGLTMGFIVYFWIETCLSIWIYLEELASSLASSSPTTPKETQCFSGPVFGHKKNGVRFSKERNRTWYDSHLMFLWTVFSPSFSRSGKPLWTVRPTTPRRGVCVLCPVCGQPGGFCHGWGVPIGRGWHWCVSGAFGAGITLQVVDVEVDDVEEDDYEDEDVDMWLDAELSWEGHEGSLPSTTALLKTRHPI